MSLTGIEIYKLLPKSNCGQCGVPTCLAFAMGLAAGKAKLESCPYIADDTRVGLEEALTPPIKLVRIGGPEEALTIGGETVMYRHEKRFENPPGIALTISDAMGRQDIEKRLRKLKDSTYERMGLKLKAELIAIKSETGDVQKFRSLVDKVTRESQAAIILMSYDQVILEEALMVSQGRKPLIYAANRENYQALASLAQRTSCPLAVKAGGVEELARLSEGCMALGVNDIVLDSKPASIGEALRDQTIIRRKALSKKARSLGYPTIVFPGNFSKDATEEAIAASVLIARYAGVIVMSDFSGESLFPLLVARLNLYTDPQRPLVTKEGVYEIGKPDENSPVIITTNFSLTYFIISGEIENSKVSAYLLVKDAEGLSVMTAWAAGKFVAGTIAPFIKKSGIEQKVTHRKLIIPGYIAGESSSIEEELGWQVIVGPKEAAFIPSFLKSWKGGDK